MIENPFAISKIKQFGRNLRKCWCYGICSENLLTPQNLPDQTLNQTSKLNEINQQKIKQVNQRNEIINLIFLLTNYRRKTNTKMKIFCPPCP